MSDEQTCESFDQPCDEPVVENGLCAEHLRRARAVWTESDGSVVSDTPDFNAVGDAALRTAAALQRYAAIVKAQWSWYCWKGQCGSCSNPACPHDCHTTGDRAPLHIPDPAAPLTEAAVSG